MQDIWSSNQNVAPGNDGLTNLVYKHCWDILGNGLVQVVQSVQGGASPTLYQKNFSYGLWSKSQQTTNLNGSKTQEKNITFKQ